MDELLESIIQTQEKTLDLIDRHANASIQIMNLVARHTVLIEALLERIEKLERINKTPVRINTVGA